MKKQIALGIAAAVLGASGVAAAVVSVNQLTALGSSESSVSAHHDQLAANCWTITGSTTDAGCNTSVAGIPVPGLPELPNLVDGVDIPDATGLLAMATDAVDTATGAASSAQGTAQGLLADATPSACGLDLPVSLPLPAGVFSAGLNLFHMAQNLAMNDLGLASVSSPVELPVTLPVSADDVINKIEQETGCLAAHAGGSPIPAVCSVEGGLPAAVTSAIPGDVTAAVPGEISGLLSSAVSDLSNITGQGINVADSGNLGVNCNIDGAVGALPATPAIPAIPAIPTAILPVLPATPALPALPAAPLVPSVPDVTGTVGGVVDTVTSTVDGILGGTLSVPNLPLPTSTPSCSGSATLVGSLLGSLTGTITGSCN